MSVVSSSLSGDEEGEMNAANESGLWFDGWLDRLSRVLRMATDERACFGCLQRGDSVVIRAEQVAGDVDGVEDGTRGTFVGIATIFGHRWAAVELIDNGETAFVRVSSIRAA